MASKETMDTIEKTLDTIEETLDVVEGQAEAAVETTKAAVNVMRKHYIITGVVAAAAFAGGVAAGYHLSKKKLRLHYEEVASAEIAEARARYRVVRNEDYATPEEAIAALMTPEEQAEVRQGEDLIEELGYSAPKQDDETLGTVTKVTTDEDGVTVDVNLTEVGEEVVVKHNLLVNNAPIEADDWDFDVEMLKRTDPTVPYIIEHDEFFENESGYDQTSLAYFSADGVLTDSADEVIRDSDATVGDDNLTRFGHGSRDENIVYVRNDKLETDFEIAYSAGSYTHEVLGLDHVVQHSDRRITRRRQRLED